MQYSAETVERLNRCFDRPTDLEPTKTNIETLQTAIPQPRADDASWKPADAGQAVAGDDEAVRVAVPSPSDADEPEYVGDSISVTAVAQSEAAFDGTGTGDWAADFARLQAALERITEKIEWRITSRTGH
jgi:hypothetical protein